ncbi:MAG: ChaN family lipoprotein [Desulfobacterales bacterium]
MKKSINILMSIVVLSGFCWAKADNFGQRVFDLNRENVLMMSQVLADLEKSRIILVGEHHTNAKHHTAQLRVIQTLKDAGLQVAIGLEMFRNESQPYLDRWVAGDIDEKGFEKIYYDNWNFPWSAYRKIFEYARNHKIPMIGLNVPRDITRQVSRNGFRSLSQEQKGKLAEVSCIVDQKYMNYIRKAFGGHGHGQLNFTYFCEAQLVWDSAMAVYSLDYLKKNPNSIVVILTGTGHAQKGAVPRQIRARSKVPYAVILPEIPGSIDAESITSKEADYIMLDLE